MGFRLKDIFTKIHILCWNTQIYCLFSSNFRAVYKENGSRCILLQWKPILFQTLLMLQSDVFLFFCDGHFFSLDAFGGFQHKCPAWCFQHQFLSVDGVF